MTSQANAFAWRTGQPSIFAADGRFTWNAKAIATNAKKIGTAFVELPAADSINVETQDCENRAHAERGLKRRKS